jgi:hypothetical protein
LFFLSKKKRPCNEQCNFVSLHQRTEEKMNNLVVELWPYVLPVLIGGIVGLVGWVHNLRTRVAILEKTVEQQQKRIDSHSVKQDGLLDKMNSMEKKFIEQVGTVRTDIQGLASDVKGLSQLILVSDKGIHMVDKL